MLSSYIAMNSPMEIYGESHTRFIGMTYYNAPIGLQISLDEIYEELTNRQGIDYINTARKENETITFLSGVENNVIIDSKISFVLENKNYRVRDYEFGVIRPSHSDIVGYQTEGFNYSYQGGGKFSGRLTALYVVIGQILKQDILKDLKNLKVYGHIKQVSNLVDDELDAKNCQGLDARFPVVNQGIKQEMINYLREVRKSGESQGAKLAYLVTGLPVGIGGMYIDSFESILSRYLFGIGGIKGLLFGAGTDYISLIGSEANDEYYTDGTKIYSDTNIQGGLNGGYTNGIQDVKFEIIVRPTPTVFTTQKTVKLTSDGWENTEYSARGRHDCFIANRVQVVSENIIYCAIYEMLH